MDEYIKREEAIEVVKHALAKRLQPSQYIEIIPAVDAVPVVRCRECKHRGTDDCIFHIKGEPADEELLLKLDNDFCSYGKRKGGAE